MTRAGILGPIASKAVPNAKGPERSWLVVFFIASLVLGAWLRFAWLSDMEYKGDERWTFDRTQHIPGQAAWPAFGMPSSVGLLNPGLSVWAFVALARLFAVHDPVGLARTVVVCNVAAFAIVFVLVCRVVAAGERESWFWGLAVAAVNPTALVLERKIWPPCLFPIFCAAFLAGWLRRDRWWGAAWWGLIGAALGQIQMSGFFWAAAFALWELSLGRLRGGRPPTKWLAWMAGSAGGAVPLVPWLRYLVGQHGYGSAYDWRAVLTFRVFRNWFSDTLGLGLDYNLGRDYWDFLRYPLFWTEDFYPALFLQGVAFTIGATVLSCSVWALWRARGSWRHLLSRLRSSSETAFTCGAALLGFGTLLTFTVVVIRRQYTEVTFPIEWVTLAYLALAHAPFPRRLLAVLWVAELALSLAFLGYIHQHHGAVGGDYGRAYRWQ